MKNNNTTEPAAAHSKDELFNALMDAATLGIHEPIPRLIQLGADPLRADPKDEAMLTALQTAVQNGHFDVVKALLPHSNPNRKDEYGRTALMIAAEEDRPEHAQIYFLLLPMTDHRIRDMDGQTLLHYAAGSSNTDVIASALSLCDPDATDDDGNTPLHAAAYAGSPHYQLLATAKNLFHANSNDDTPADLYKLKGLLSEAQDLERIATSMLEKEQLLHSTPQSPKPKTTTNKPKL